MRWSVWMLVIIESCCLLSAPVRAATEMGSARVEILPAINVSQLSEVDFGRIHNVDGTCVMTAQGALTGTAGMGCAGSETPGAFTISGGSGSLVVLSVSQGALDGVTFHPVIEGSLQRALVDGVTTVTVLGSLVVDGASEGVKQISYTFTANYQ